MNAYLKEYIRWLDSPELDKRLRAEMEGIAKEIEERFYTEIEFGTAGLRGILGAGPNRMNVHVVRRATKGLADYINSCCNNQKAPRVAIAYDPRNMSDIFAREAALVLAANGIEAHLFETLHSVPQLSFALRHLKCIAGIVITASHNPPQYNGYKVYWSDGGQAGPKQASKILECIQKIDYFNIASTSESRTLDAGLLVPISKDVDEAYYSCAETLLQHPQLLREKGSDFNLVYTPLHGSGYVPVTTLLKRIGLNNVHVVAAQAHPDGSFPTVTAPNPEDPDAFVLACALADDVNADVILATDPDSDRLGVSVRDANGTFEVLTGNQIGCVLLHYLLSSMDENGTLPSNGLVVKSLVSTRMADAICKRYDVKIVDVPTGFRFIASEIAKCEHTGENQFIFGFEESFGYLAGSFVRDKDAICAAMLFSEACIYCSSKGMAISDMLDELYSLYGYFKEASKSYTLEGKEGMERIAGTMKHLRENIPQSLNGITINCAEDLLPGTCVSLNDNTESKTDIQGIDVLRYKLPNDAWVCVRPSGTEPKLKLYIGASAEDENQVDDYLAQITQGADDLLCKLLGI